MKQITILFVVLLSVLSKAVAQPANDCPCSAVTITVGSACVTGDNIGATHNTAGGGCENGIAACVSPSGDIDASVWYKFVATDDSITVNLGDGTMASVAITSVYSATSCSSGFSCIRSAKGGAEVDATGLTIGTTYYIRVDGGKNGGSQMQGTFCISVYETPPPPPPIGTCLNPRNIYPGNDCKNISGTQYDEQNNILSTNVSANGGPDGGAAITGTASTDNTCSGGGGTIVGKNSYWIEVNTGNNTSLTFANCTEGCSGSVAEYFTIYPANVNCSSPSGQINCASVNANSSTSFSGLTANTSYLVQITGTTSTNPTTVFACVTASNPYTPPNDNCSNATTLDFGVAYTLNNSNASVDLNNTLCSGSTENNVWVKYTANYTGTAYVFLQDQDCACGNGMQMSIFNAGASCPNNSSTCSIYINPNNDNDFSGDFNVTNGSTYYIQLDGYAGCGCEFNLCLSSINSADCSALLPIELARFDAFFADDNLVRLSWLTKSEKNSDHFRVERSIDGINYEFVEQLNAMGISNSEVEYTAYDRHPVLNQLSYYRLIQTDLDGSQHAYTPIVVSPKGKNQIVFFPNPSESHLDIEVPGHTGEIFIRLINNQGQSVYVKTEINNSDLHTLDLQGLEAGSYLLEVITENRKFTDRIIKR